jgi:hypothetical protein
VRHDCTTDVRAAASFLNYGPRASVAPSSAVLAIHNTTRVKGGLITEKRFGWDTSS